MVKVTAMLAAYAVEGVSYGPFQATEDRPFLEVPEALANALNLPRYEEDGQTDAKDQDAHLQGNDAADVVHLREVLKRTADAVLHRQDFLTVPRFDAQHPEGMDVAQAVAAGLDDLKAQLTQAQGVGQALERRLSEAQQAHADEKAEWEQQRAGLLKDTADALKREDALQAELAAVQTQATPDPTTTGTPLVEGLPAPELLTQHGFDTMEKLEAGLRVPEGVEQSPVQAVSGIGKKSVEAYQKAVTDWRAEQP